MQPPSAGRRLLDRYRDIECTATRMLDAGRAGDWARVTRIESEIRELADRLSTAATSGALAPEEQRERLRVLRRLLLIDGDLRRLAHPENRWLDTMFDPRRAEASARRGD